MTALVVGVDPSLRNFGYTIARCTSSSLPVPVAARLVTTAPDDGHSWSTTKANERIHRAVAGPRAILDDVERLGETPRLIVFESFSPGRSISERAPVVPMTNQSIGTLAGLAAVWRCPVVACSPAAVKLAACKRRSATKATVMAGVRAQIGDTLDALLDEHGMPRDDGKKTRGRDHVFDAFAAILSQSHHQIYLAVVG